MNARACDISPAAAKLAGLTLTIAIFAGLAGCDADDRPEAAAPTPTPEPRAVDPDERQMMDAIVAKMAQRLAEQQVAAAPDADNDATARDEAGVQWIENAVGHLHPDLAWRYREKQAGEAARAALAKWDKLLQSDASQDKATISELDAARTEVLQLSYHQLWSPSGPPPPDEQAKIEEEFHVARIQLQRLLWQNPADTGFWVSPVWRQPLPLPDEMAFSAAAGPFVRWEQVASRPTVMVLQPPAEKIDDVAHAFDLRAQRLDIETIDFKPEAFLLDARGRLAWRAKVSHLGDDPQAMICVLRRLEWEQAPTQAPQPATVEPQPATDE